MCLWFGWVSFYIFVQLSMEKGRAHCSALEGYFTYVERFLQTLVDCSHHSFPYLLIVSFIQHTFVEALLFSWYCATFIFQILFTNFYFFLFSLKEKCPIHWFASQMTTIVRSGSNKRQEPGAPLGSPKWEAGTHKLGPSSAAFPRCELTRS